MRQIVTLMLCIVALIHLLPVVGVLGVAQLNSLYGLTVSDVNLELLLRHRAVLFALLGGFLLLAAFRPALRKLALILGYVSVLSFLYLALSLGGYNQALARVLYADVIALVCLLIASVAAVLEARAGR
jgi:hypothetical protein